MNNPLRTISLVGCVDGVQLSLLGESCKNAARHATTDVT